jgi:hypothetical protein
MWALLELLVVYNPADLVGVREDRMTLPYIAEITQSEVASEEECERIGFEHWQDLHRVAEGVASVVFYCSSPETELQLYRRRVDAWNLSYKRARAAAAKKQLDETKAKLERLLRQDDALFLALYTVQHLMVGDAEWSDPKFTEISFLFPTEAACKKAAEWINSFSANDPDDFQYAHRSLRLVAKCEADNPVLEVPDMEETSSGSKGGE